MSFLGAQQPAGGVVREGKKLVVPRVGGLEAGAELPPICVKCGLPSEKPLRRNFFWYAPWLYVLLLFPLIFLIVALVARRKMVLHVPMCENHRSRRRNLLLMAAGIAVAGLFVPFLMNAMGSDVALGVALMIVMLLAGAIIGSQVSNPIQPSRIDDRCGVFTGCAEVFLQQFPPGTSQVLPTMTVTPVSSAPSPVASRSSVPPPPPPPVQSS
jgi:hypothetical protein